MAKPVKYDGAKCPVCGKATRRSVPSRVWICENGHKIVRKLGKRHV